MKIPKYIDERIEEMQESKRKQAWQELKETNDVYTIIPCIDTLNFRYKNITSYLKMKPLESLKYASRFYHYVNDIYQNYDFILHQDFFDCFVHPNEYDAIYVTKKTRNNANKICEKIDNRIKELEKK